MKKVTRGVYDPVILGKNVPRRDHGSREEVERDGYSVRVINRGEQLSYIDAELGEVVAEIFIPTAWIDADSIRLWDNERAVTDEQRAVILARVADYWQRKNGNTLRVIHGAQP